MKILFATGKLNSVLSATHKIVYQLAGQLQANGHQCSVCGFSFDCDESESLDRGVHVYRWNSPLAYDAAQLKFDKYVQQLGANKRDGARKSFMLSHPFSSALLALRYSGFIKPARRAAAYADRVKKLVLKEKYDAVVAVYMPFDEAMHTAKALRGIVPVCLYQADPWGLHRDEKLAKDQELHILQETELFGIADHVITTPALYRLYLEHEAYMPFAEKLTPMNFPNIRPSQQNDAKSVFDFDKDSINLLFCGLLEDEYRSPQLFLQTAQQLIDEGMPLKIHFLGNSTSKSLVPFMKKYPQNIIHHQAVSLAQAVATMKAADFLLNISNTLDNQVPSKIFDYFSLGKPVLNVQKIDNCPSREYFDRYPLAFTLCDRNPDADKMKEFLLSAKGKTISFDTVSELFHDATLEYAADTTEKILADILKI